MEECKLLRLFILCNCITLSVQIFVMENESNKKVLKWEESYDFVTEGAYFELDVINSVNKLIVLGRLILKFRSVSNGNLTKIWSTNYKEVLDAFVKASKKSNTLKIKFLADKFKKYCEKKRDDKAVLQPTLTLDVPPSWNKEIILNQLEQVEGRLFVNGNGLLNIEATGGTPIKITGRSTKYSKLMLKDDSTFGNNQNYTFFMEGDVDIDIDNKSRAYLGGSDKTTFVGNVQRNSILVLYGDEIDESKVDCDSSSIIVVKNRK